MSPLTLLLLAPLLLANAHAQVRRPLPLPPENPVVTYDCPTAISDGGRLSPPDADYFEKRALAGDVYPAFRLSYHFQALGDRIAYDRWQLRAAELGHPVAQYNQWFALKDAADCSTRRVALNWLKQSANHGDLDAKSKFSNYRDAVLRDCGAGK